MITQYFCWLCDHQADPDVPSAPHYEQRRTVRFCCWPHRNSYLQLACL